MARALSSSIGAGSTAAIVLRLLDQIDRRSAPLDPGAVCSILHPEPTWHIPSILAGIFVGFLIYPVCEAILTYRLVVFRAVWDRVSQPLQTARSLYRFV
jgi:hypothetical protein